MRGLQVKDYCIPFTEVFPHIASCVAFLHKNPNALCFHFHTGCVTLMRRSATLATEVSVVTRDACSVSRASLAPTVE